MEFERITGWPSAAGVYWYNGALEDSALILINGDKGYGRHVRLRKKECRGYVFWGPVQPPAKSEKPTGWPKAEGYYWAKYWVCKNGGKFQVCRAVQLVFGDDGVGYGQVYGPCCNSRRHPNAKFWGPLSMPAELAEMRAKEGEHAGSVDAMFDTMLDTFERALAGQDDESAA